MLNEVVEGSRVEVFGDEYEVCHIDGRRLRLAAVGGGQSKYFDRVKLAALFAAETARIIYKPPNNRGSERSFLTFSDEQVRKALWRRDCIVYIDKQLGPRWGKEKVEKLLQSCDLEWRDDAARSYASVMRWRKMYREADESLTALMSREDERGPRDKRFPPEAWELFIETLAAFAANPRNLKAKTIRQAFITKALSPDFDDIVFSSDGKPPSPRTINRWLNQSDLLVRLTAKCGAKKAKKLLRAAGRSTELAETFSFLQADGNLMDILIIDPDTGEVVGRAYLTVIFDPISSCVVAFFISCAPFSACTILATLRQAITSPEDPTTSPRGVPKTLVIDNGSDYISNALRLSCFKLGLEIRCLRTGDPNGKAEIERFFREVGEFLHDLPGTTWSNPQERGDYESENLACVTLDMLRTGVSRWIEIYHRDDRGEKRRTPLALWNEFLRLNGEPTTYSAEEADILCRRQVSATVVSGRVRNNFLFWKSHLLRESEVLCREQKKKLQVEFLIDDSDLSCVFARMPGSTQIIKLDSTTPIYCTGLSSFEHDLIRERKKELIKKKDHAMSDFELYVERERLRDELIEEAKTNKRAVRRLARINESKVYERPTVREEKTGDKLAATRVELPDIEADSPVTEELSAFKIQDIADDASLYKRVHVRNVVMGES